MWRGAFKECFRMISIIIPTFNKKYFTINCLKDLSKLNNIYHQIILIDNGSTDGTVDDIKKLNLYNLTIIQNTSNDGFGKACNKAYQNSVGEIVLFLNNDIRVQNKFEDWTDILLNHMEENILIGPTGGYVDPNNNFSFLYETTDSNKKINYMSGWCLAATRKTFDKLTLKTEIGPFDSNNFFCFYEDTDLSFRATENGINFKLIDLPLVHFGHVTSNSIGTNKYYTESRNKFIEKWKSKI